MLPRTDRGCNRFEIGFGLARPGHAIEQEGGEAMLLHRRDKAVRHVLLGAVQHRLGIVCPREEVGAVAIDHYRLQHTLIDQPAQHPFADIGQTGQFADRRLFAFQCGHCPFALGRHPFGHSARQAVFGHRRRAFQRAAARQDHPRDRCQRGAVIVRSPFDQPPQFGAQWRHWQYFEQRTQAAVRNPFRRKPTFLPHDSDHLTRAKRSKHDRSRHDIHAIGHAIVERAERGIHHQESGAVHI